MKAKYYLYFINILNNNHFTFFFCGLIGAISFINIYGVAVLDFTYTNWFMNGGDLSQHYLGWCYFRNSDWHFPIGMMDNIIYPFRVSVIYTDSIPLFAIIFKLLSPILPDSFQYFGFFGIICYFMQGAVSGLIVKRLSNNTLYAIISSIFFTLSTTMAWRMFAHTTLSAHFIILLCIYVCITKVGKERSTARNIAIWSGLLCLSSVTHLYFVPITLIFMFFYLIDDFFDDKKITKQIIIGMSSISLMLILMSIMGAFYTNTTKYAGGLGYYSANLLSLLNPYGTSTFIKNITPATSGQYEGYGYLGLGIIAGCFLVITIFLKNIKEINASLKSNILLRRLILTGMLFILFFIIALSPVVTFRDKVLFTYPVPGIISDVWGIFRSSGRFIWIPAYIIMFTIIIVIRREYSIRISIIILSILLFTQIMDTRGYIYRKGVQFSERVEWSSQLPSSEWNLLAEHYDHIVFLHNLIYRDISISYAIADIATRNNMTTNDFNVSRKDGDSIDDYRSLEIQRIIDGEASDETLYILSYDLINLERMDERLINMLYVYEIDGVYIGLIEPFLDNKLL